jgi:hypothetical protein
MMGSWWRVSTFGGEIVAALKSLGNAKGVFSSLGQLYRVSGSFGSSVDWTFVRN